MRKITALFTAAALLSGTALQAQATGGGAANSSSTAQGNNWQNWAFAGSAIVTAAIGVFVVTMNNGQSSQSH